MPSQGPLVEHGELLDKRANGFDPKAYNLIVKARLYDRENTIKLIAKGI